MVNATATPLAVAVVASEAEVVVEIVRILLVMEASFIVVIIWTKWKAMRKISFTHITNLDVNSSESLEN